MDNRILCYDGFHIWYNDKPEIKVMAQYPSSTYVDVNNPSITVSNVKELEKLYENN